MKKYTINNFGYEIGMSDEICKAEDVQKLQEERDLLLIGLKTFLCAIPINHPHEWSTEDINTVLISIKGAEKLISKCEDT